MRKPRLNHVLAIALAACAACGSKKSNDTPDAAGNPDAAPTPDAGKMACDELMSPIATIDALPGTYTGTVTGGGADLDVAQGICTVEKDGQYYEPKGEDVVVKVTGLTVGQNYGITLTTAEDLGFYVISGCTDSAGGPATGQCDLFDDEYLDTENAMFTATATEEYIVVDNSADPSAPATGDFTLDVVAAQCDVDAATTTCTSPTPFCVGYECVECSSDFDCTTAGKPVCDPTGTCVVSTSGCTGDDARDSGNGDDGPAAATTLAAPSVATPTSITGAICDTPTGEGDWFKVTLAAAGDLGVSLDFTGATNDLDVGLIDSTGALVNSGSGGPGEPEAFTATGLAAGTYYVEVIQTAPTANAAAVSYTLGLNVPVCTTSFDCKTAGKPVCAGNGVCAVGPTQCVGDDSGDSTSGGDDGPAGSRSLTPIVGTPASLTGKVCGAPGNEADFYTTTVATGGTLDITLTWTGADDLDVTAYDANGRIYGVDYWRSPAEVKLTFLQAGVYYYKVTKYDPTASTVVTPYTISVATTGIGLCTGTTDCAAEYQTQLYRGQCTAGSCRYLATTNVADNGACDSGAECTSGLCSYNLFQGNAQKSKCSEFCDTTADCTTAGLTGFVCATSGGTGFYCEPACGADTDCGTADPNDGAIDTGLPWNYGTCTVATGVCDY